MTTQEISALLERGYQFFSVSLVGFMIGWLIGLIAYALTSFTEFRLEPTFIGLLFSFMNAYMFLKE